MDMAESLDIYLCNRLVGELNRNVKGELSFRYHRDYLMSTSATALSATLPLSPEPFGERDIAAFFSNLLPDEGVRRRVAEILSLTSEDTFGLLRAIGGDCAGAIAFYEHGRHPENPSHPTYRPLSEQEAVMLLNDLANRPLGIADDFQGISGAGAQDKLIACWKDGCVLLPLNGTPSTHIIKPGIDRFPQSVFNEWFCMRLSRSCGFDTAECELLTLGNDTFYMTRRYDRRMIDGVVTRLHQEDFCQLLKCRPEIKYQDQGGPSLVECANVIRTLRLPGADLLAFVNRAIFNFIVGNGDAHGKNFSVLYDGNTPRLAPAYDILCTTGYPSIAKRMAMKFDGKYEFRWVTAGKIVRTFARAGIGEKVVYNSIAHQIENVRKFLPQVIDEANASHPASIYREIARGIYSRMGQLESSWK